MPISDGSVGVSMFRMSQPWKSWKRHLEQDTVRAHANDAVVYDPSSSSSSS